MLNPAVIAVAASSAEFTGADQFRVNHGFACQACVGLANATSAIAAFPRLQQQLVSIQLPIRKIQLVHLQPEGIQLQSHSTSLFAPLHLDKGACNAQDPL